MVFIPFCLKKIKRKNDVYERKYCSTQFYFTRLKQKQHPKGAVFVLIGGAKEGRTPDLLNAIQALCQLSYNPNNKMHHT